MSKLSDLVKDIPYKKYIDNATLVNSIISNANKNIEKKQKEKSLISEQKIIFPTETKSISTILYIYIIMACFRRLTVKSKISNEID